MQIISGKFVQFKPSLKKLNAVIYIYAEMYGFYQNEFKLDIKKREGCELSN